MNFKTRLILTILLVVILGGIFFIAEAKKTDRVGLVFCDVGQGDGFVVLGPSSEQVVFDSGLGSRAAECLSRYVPLWDKNIELLVLTHPERDHMDGQIEVLRRYKVEKIVWTGAQGKSALFEQWKKMVEREGAQVFEVARGDKIEADGANYEVLWPTKSFMDLWRVAPGDGFNETSLVVRANFGNVCAYFTGDIPVERLVDVVDRSCQILKVAHHGSKTGTNEELVSLAGPQIAVIQSGAGNSYGHPKPEVLEFFNKFDVNILRNDLLGDIKLRFDRDGVLLEN